MATDREPRIRVTSPLLRARAWNRASFGPEQFQKKAKALRLQNPTVFVDPTGEIPILSEASDGVRDNVGIEAAAESTADVQEERGKAAGIGAGLFGGLVGLGGELVAGAIDTLNTATNIGVVSFASQPRVVSSNRSSLLGRRARLGPGEPTGSRRPMGRHQWPVSRSPKSQKDGDPRQV